MERSLAWSSGVEGCTRQGRWSRRFILKPRSHDPFKTIRTLLDRYLQGREVDFEIEVDISHLGAFTRKVLNELRKILFGETRKYGWLAKKVGKAGAARAVGQGSKGIRFPSLFHAIVSYG